MELFVKIKEGDRGAFKALFDGYYLELLRVAVYYVRDVEAAKDIVQEVYVKLWENRSGLVEVGNERGYLQNSVRNRCLNYLEHVTVVDKYQRLYVEEDPGEEDTEELFLRVRALLEQLPEKRRKILELSILESKTYREIAEDLGIQVNTVKDHIRKAYAFLRARASKETFRSILYLIFHGKKLKF